MTLRGFFRSNSQDKTTRSRNQIGSMTNRGKGRREGPDMSGRLEKRRQISPNNWPKYLSPCENHRSNARVMNLETYPILPINTGNNKIGKWKRGKFNNKKELKERKIESHREDRQRGSNLSIIGIWGGGMGGEGEQIT